MKKRKNVLCGMLCLTLLGMTAQAEEPGYFDVYESDSGTKVVADTMRVVNCEEWVSLRREPDANSERLEYVPLGAEVYDCQWYSDEFIYGEYEGQYGYILSQYLTRVRVINEENGADEWKDRAYFTYWEMPWETLTQGGTEVFSYESELYTIAAYRDYESGEALRVGCYDTWGNPVWGYLTGVDYMTELNATEAFLGGTVHDPQVIVNNTDLGLYGIDPATGEVIWKTAGEELSLSGSVSHAVGADGTMYLAGYYGPDPIAVSPDGEVLWRSDAGNEDVYWPYQISVEGDSIVVNYESGNGYDHYVAVYDIATGRNTGIFLEEY